MTRVRSFADAFLRGFWWSFGIGGICGLGALLLRAFGPRDMAAGFLIASGVGLPGAGLFAIIGGLIFSIRSGPAKKVSATMFGYGCRLLVLPLVGCAIYYAF